MRKQWIIGIDEVGRGPFAGPVTVAAMAVARGFTGKGVPGLHLRDSKKLSPEQREKWFRHIKELSRKGVVRYVIASVSPKVIDRINIARAANRAATRAFKKLLTMYGTRLTARGNVFLDGGLFLQGEYREIGETIIKGDEKILAVMCASIVAKVHRDHSMERLHKKHPHYGFDAHKGYGTKKHIQAIRKHGVSDAHRLTFLSKYNNLKRK